MPTKREARLRRERHRLGGPHEGHGWAARQASKHGARGRSVSQRKTQGWRGKKAA